MKFFNKIKSILTGNIIYSASQFVILLTIIKFGTSYDLGVYTLVISIITPLSVFLGFQLRNQLAVDSENRLNTQIIFRARNILNGIMILFSFFLYLFLGAKILLIFALFKILDSYLEIIYGLLLRDSKNDLMGKLLSIKSIANLIVFSSIYILSQNLLLTMTIQVIVLLIIIIIYRNIAREMLTKVTSTRSESAIKLILNTLPLAISALLISITPQIPRYFLGAIESVEMVGVFSSLSYLIVVGTLFVNSINSSFYNEYSNLITSGKYSSFMKQLVKNILIYLGLWIILCLIVIIFKEDLLVVIFNEDFSSYFTEFIIIAFSSIFLFISTLFINFTLFTQQYRYQLYIYLIVNIFSVILSFTFIKNYGVTGASIALGVTYLVQLIVSFIFFVIIFRRRISNEE